MKEILNPSKQFWDLSERIIHKQETIGVIGCGYIGMSLIEAFTNKCEHIIGFDTDKYKINDLNPHKQGLYCYLEYTYDFLRLYECEVIFICVPTPLKNNEPDLSFVNNALTSIVDYTTANTLIIIESSVDIGRTRTAVQYVEHENGIRCGENFFMGYSPERIMPGNTKHNLNNTPKIIAGYDTCSRELMRLVYSKICDEIVLAKRLEEAEAAKLIENTQRDVNIAFMNECYHMLDKKDIEAYKVFDLCRSHWNWLDFKPGLVGGSCIPVNPYYLWALDYKNDDDTLLTLARYINERMPVWIAEQINHIVENQGDKDILILGVTYKDNVKSDKNSGIYKLKNELMDWSYRVQIWDSKLNLDNIKDSGYDIVIIGTASKWVLDFVNSKDIHNFYKKNLPEDERVLIDLPGVLDGYVENYKYWRLR